MKQVVNKQSIPLLLTEASTKDEQFNASSESGKHEVGFSTATAIKSRAEKKLKQPRLYKVILLNDHYTSMEFVTLVLQSVFHKTQAIAEQIMLTVHQTGAGIAGIYTKEIAETKVALVHHLARQHEFPLKCSIEPE